MSAPSNTRRFWKKIVVAVLLLAIGLIAAFCYLARERLAQVGKDWRDRPVAASIQSQGAFSEPYLTINWPSIPGSPAQQAISFRIPRAYVHPGTTLIDEKGIESISIIFELPNASPWKNRPGFNEKKSMVESIQPKRPLTGRFTLQIDRELAYLYDLRMEKREQLLPDPQFDLHPPTTSTTSVRLADLHGLERYSDVTCYSPETRKKQAGIDEFLKKKAADDPSSDNCSVNDMRLITLVSGPAEKDDDEAVFIRCLVTGCYAYFSVEGRGVRMGLSYENLAQWKESTGAARELIQSFIINNSDVNAHGSPSTKKNNTPSFIEKLYDNEFKQSSFNYRLSENHSQRNRLS